MSEEIKQPQVDIEEQVASPELVADQAEGPENQAAGQPEASETPDSVEAQLRELKDQVEQEQNLRLRLQADFDNFRKRKTKEAADSVRFANQDLLLQLLPVLDNFDRTLDMIDKTDNLTAIKEGIAIVDKNMRHTLQKIGLETIHSVGKEFDPEMHEVITTIPAPTEEQKDRIIDEVEKGYKLRERVIRVAKVILGE